MRTTVRLDDDLLSDAKALAARRGQTLTALIEEGVRQQLAREGAPGESEPVVLPTFNAGGGLRPGVDLDDNAATLELLEEDLPLQRRR